MTDDKKLRIRAATVFKHLFNELWECVKVSEYQASGLSKCQKHKCNHRHCNESIPDTCPHPSPLDINDWNVAFKIFRSLDVCERVNIWSALVEIFLREIDDDKKTPDIIVAENTTEELLLQADSWLWSSGEPKHLILAACEAVERGKG